MHRDGVALFPVIAHAVMHVEAAPFQNIKESFVLVAVSFVARRRRQRDEMSLQALGHEGLVDRADDVFFARFAVEVIVVVFVDHPRNRAEALAPRFGKRISLTGDTFYEDARFIISGWRIGHIACLLLKLRIFIAG